MRLRFSFSALICLTLPPCRPKNWLLRQLGWKIGPGCGVGFSWVDAKHIELSGQSRIGHFNFVCVDVLVFGTGAYIGHQNRVSGPLWVVLGESAGVGNQNKIIRGPRGVVWGRAMLKLGKWSKITVGHVIDCTRSVIIGNYSILAGRGSQVWTHGYLHAPDGLDRFRIDGSIRIGSNVYIGSACVFNAGVKVGDAITVGAASCVSRSLERQGLYVSQPLRYIELEYDQAYQRYPNVGVEGLVEKVVNKRAGDDS